MCGQFQIISTVSSLPPSLPPSQGSSLSHTHTHSLHSLTHPLVGLLLQAYRPTSGSGRRAGGCEEGEVRLASERTHEGRRGARSFQSVKFEGVLADHRHGKCEAEKEKSLSGVALAPSSACLLFCFCVSVCLCVCVPVCLSGLFSFCSFSWLLGWLWAEFHDKTGPFL